MESTPQSAVERGLPDPLGAAGSFGRQTTVSRRSLLKGAALGALALGPLSACGGSGTTEIRFMESKPEVIGYFDTLITSFEKKNPNISVVHDSNGANLVAAMVRGKPHDLVMQSYDFNAGLFVSRGVLTDLGDLPQAKLIDPNVQKLVGEYATTGSSLTDVLPYSVTAAGTIYNKDIFAKYDLQVPTTWDELITICKTLQSKGVTPFYGTYRDTWTIAQGLFDYVAGGAIDVADFYARLKAEGADADAGSTTSFTKDFAPAVDKMKQLLPYFNKDAGARAYPDGNAAFAAGKAAMYLQGPWAIGEVNTLAPKMPLATFPLPVTDDPADLKVRVNLDLAAWIPDGAGHPEQAQELLQYFLQQDVWYKYNQDNLAYTPVKNPPPVQDERIAGLAKYVTSGAFYQGPETFVPATIPLGNYLQSFVLTGDGDALLSHLDSDWHRVAQRLAA